MRSLGAVIAQSHPKKSAPRYRRGSRFVRDIREHATPLDRNQRARLIAQAEAIERRTKGKGQRTGILGLTGLAVLRALVLHFQNGKTGLCFPSYRAIMAKTGFSRQTVARAIRALEAVGVLRVVRRLVRREIERDGATYVGTVQASSLYAFQIGAPISIRPIPERQARSFPKPNALFALLFSSRVHSAGRNYPNQPQPTTFADAKRGFSAKP